MYFALKKYISKNKNVVNNVSAKESTIKELDSDNFNGKQNAPSIVPLYIPIIQKVPFRPILGEKPKLANLVSTPNVEAFQHLDQMIINPSFLYHPTKYIIQKGFQYSHEFLYYWDGASVQVTHPGTHITYFFYVNNHQTELQILKAGEPVGESIKSLPKEIIVALLQAEIIVPRDYFEAQVNTWRKVISHSHQQLKQEGYSVIQNLLNPLQLDFIREYHRNILNEFTGGKKITTNHHSYNDEVLARYFNIEFTQLVSELCGQPLVHSSLALTSWIHPGNGFLLHTDTNPPFDITLDIVVDHEGISHRTLNFIKKNPSSLIPQTRSLNLSIGESVLFLGSEIPHFGSDFPSNHYHNVLLFTWEFVKD